MTRFLYGLYRRTRPLMPPVRHVRFAGIPTPGWVRVTDLLVPAAWRAAAEDQPGYEEGLVQGIRAHVRPGDRVVVVGSGMGVTSVVAAIAAGPDGTVEAYEASDHMLGIARRTLGLHHAGRRIQLHHAIVAANHGVYGETSATVLPPGAIPESDVLVMDCEGAEREILPALGHRPRAILVETHGLYDAPTALVRELLETAGYRIVSDQLAETRIADYCTEHDIRVLAALRDAPVLLMILVVDNYDSFTYNLVHLVAARTSEVRVVRNDQITVREVAALDPAGILISPGPGRPEDAGISEALVRDLGPSIPILGVCLGHQAIGRVYGGRIVSAPTLMHGKTSRLRHDGAGVFEGVPQDFVATRYHSLVVDRASLPGDLAVTASCDDGVVMGLRHRTHPVEGVQFHPESVLTVEGPRLVHNWVEMALAHRAASA